MRAEAHQKVTTSHLKRDAYLYVRQSTLRQVFENTESTTRQYGLRERAVALGWPVERVVTIDSDLGQSAASAADREGFQKLVAEVGLGHVGIVLGLEVSRLARSSTDWHRLLEICALTDTLILDEDGVYDPGHFNDRLLLGLKGTMSEAELHVLHARLQGGVLSKASRGELRSPLPTGFVYAPDSRVVLDPDEQVRDAIQLFFQTFHRTGSAWTTVQLFRQQGWLFPRRVRAGQHKGEIIWAPLLHNTARQVLHNPRYAGAFAYGRTHTRKTADGHGRVDRLARDEWHALLLDSHPGYISWQDYEDHLRQLHENAQAHGSDRRSSPPREGPALLQGLAICGRCGGRMTVRYHTRRGRLIPDYMCQRDGVEHGRPICQAVSGVDLETAIGQLLVEAVTPLALEVALTVQQELDARADEADRLRRQQLDRARYEADLAQRRYLQVDPDNRLVADALEADWNDKLRTLAAAHEDYDRRRQADGRVLNEQQRREILALATDFPRLWRDPQTPDRERKRMVRLLLEDVTLLKGEEITAHVRFKGGAVRTLTLPLPRGHETDPAVLRQIDQLLEHHTDAQIAFILNQRGVVSSGGQPFGRLHIRDLRQTRDLQDRFTRLRTAGYLTLDEIATALHVCTDTVKKWRRGGLLRAQLYNDKSQYLYEPLGKHIPPKWKHKLHHRQPAALQQDEV
jgi:DNA invertase Pin-like site-specific DNA recombinase